MEKISQLTTNRRSFLGTITTGMATMGMAGLMAPLQQLNANPVFSDLPDPDKWFNNIKGKHRIVFDVPQPHEILPFAWPKVFLLTNDATGTPAKDCSVVVILRHSAIGYAFEDRLWSKYNLGEVFKADDPATGKPSMRNPFWKPAMGAYKIPGFGEIEIGIDQLQGHGVMFCVCQAAMKVYSAAVAGGMKQNADDVLADWKSGLLPGIQPVPSGVWAVGRAQEHGCAYCFVG